MQASNPDNIIRLNHDWDVSNVILHVDLADMGRPQDDHDVAELMLRRCVEQARAFGSPCPAHAGLADDGYEPRYQVTSDVEEMRRQHHERDDPLDIDGPPPEPRPSAEEFQLFDADFTGYRFVGRWSLNSWPYRAC